MTKNGGGCVFCGKKDIDVKPFTIGLGRNKGRLVATCYYFNFGEEINSRAFQMPLCAIHYSSLGLLQLENLSAITLAAKRIVAELDAQERAANPPITRYQAFAMELE